MKPDYLPKHSRGFSLVELMVSMVIALVVLAGVVNSFLASRAAFQFNRELAFIQDNGRYATELLSREIREAGYFGCDSVNAIKVNTLKTTLDSLVDGSGLQGFEYTGGIVNYPAFFASDVRASSDAIIVRRADTDNSIVVSGHNENSSQISIVGTHNIPPDSVLVIADDDCSHIGIFSNSGPNTIPANNVVHNKGNSTPGNCTSWIKGNGLPQVDGVADCADCTNSGSCNWQPSVAGDGEYDEDSTLFRMSAKVFYVSNSTIDTTMPTLVMQNLGNAGAINRVELAPGVEDFQLMYGVVSGAGNTGTPLQYVLANAVTDWDLVSAVRISMVVRSEAQVLQQATSRTLLGVTYNDKYLRQLITTTIQVRNRI